MIELYDLAAADPAVRFSPFCWRTRMALAHKGLAVDAKPWRFTETAALAFSGQGRVPVIRDGGIVVSDSWAIARDLDARYPDRPSLLGGAAGEAHARFLNSWADTTLHPGVVRLVIADVYAALAPQDQGYFRETREARFGAPLDKVQSSRDRDVLAFRQMLTPLRVTLTAQPFLGGQTPTYADYIAFGGFMWARAVSAFELLEPTDVMAGWRERLLDLHGGLARKAPVAWR